MRDTLSSVCLQSAPGVTVSFDAEGLTEYGGATLLAETLDAVGWRELLRRFYPFERVLTPIGYFTEEVITSAVVGIALGARRPEHLDRIRADVLPRTLLEPGGLPSSVTVWRHLKEYKLHGGEEPAGLLDELNVALVRRMLGRGSGVIDLDIDATPCTVYGKQEGAAKGYNPQKKGKRSYFPMLAACVEKQLVFGHLWRKGNSGAGTGDTALLDIIWNALPAGRRDHLRLRADSGHFDGKLMSWCEERHVPFVIKARKTTALMREVYKLEFGPLRLGDRELEVAESAYKSDEWPRARRCLVYRERKTEIRDAQGKLFEESLYKYSVIVTSLRWSAAEIWEHYNARGEAENMIEDLKNSIGYGVAATDEMLANRVWSTLQILAFNLLSPLRAAIAKREHVCPKVRTLRERLLRVAAKVAHHSRRTFVRLKQSWADAPLFRHLLTLAPSTA